MRRLWTGTGSKDLDASDILYAQALAASDTVDTMSGNKHHGAQVFTRAWRQCSANTAGAPATTGP